MSGLSIEPTGNPTQFFVRHEGEEWRPVTVDGIEALWEMAAERPLFVWPAPLPTLIERHRLFQSADEDEGPMGLGGVFILSFLPMAVKEPG
jgi:hypothetical protein